MTTETMTVEDFIGELENNINQTPFEFPETQIKEKPEEAPVEEQKVAEIEVDFEKLGESSKEEETTEENDEEDGEEVSTTIPLKAQLFKATAELLQEQFQIAKEDLDLSALADEDWTEETFQELVNELVSYGAESKYSNYKNSNEEIAAILDIVERGGSLKELDEYRGRRAAIDEIDVSTPDGKLQKIKAYYKQVEGWEADKIDDYIEFIQNKNSVDKELKSVETRYEGKFANEREAIVQKQKEIAQRKQQQEQMIAQSFSQILENEKYSKKDKGDISNFVFNKNLKLKSTGEVISQLEYKLLETRSKPEELFELSKFLMDRDKYIQEVITKHNNQKVENKFSKLFSGSGKSSVTKEKTTNKTANKFQFFND